MLCPKIEDCEYFEDPTKLCYHAIPHEKKNYSCDQAACNCCCEEYYVGIEFLKVEEFEI